MVSPDGNILQNHMMTSHSGECMLPNTIHWSSQISPVLPILVCTCMYTFSLMQFYLMHGFMYPPHSTNKSTSLSFSHTPIYILVSYYPAKVTSYSSLASLYSNLFIHLYFERRREGERGWERGRETSMCACHSQPGTWPMTQACALWFLVQWSIHWATPTRARRIRGLKLWTIKWQ